VRRHFDATVNDVVLAVVSGALHRFLARRGVDVTRLSDFRAMVPASTHAAADPSVSGNKVAMLLTPLPVDEADPVRRIARVRATTRALKHASNQVAAGELLIRVSDVTAPSLMPAVLRLALRRRAFNLVVTNIPGPPFPLYLLGCRLRSFHPIVNLWPGQALGLAFFSYAGTLYCGLHADREAVAELDGLVADFDASLAELGDAAREDGAPPIAASA
jgi:WS/DGAT/MGAT family acyltransferase